jgi:hypothetical protein
MRIDPQAAQSLRGELKAAEDAIKRAQEDYDRARTRHSNILDRIKAARDADAAYWDEVMGETGNGSSGLACNPLIPNEGASE